MSQAWIKFARRGLPFFVAVLLTVLAIIVYNMSEWLEKYHPKLVENIHYAIAAVLLFGGFYVVVLLARVVWTYGDDDDDH